MPVNRKSERPFRKSPPSYSGGEGFYIFVPASEGKYSERAPGQTLPNAEAIQRAQAAIAPFIEGRPPRKKMFAAQATFEFVANEWFEINKDRWVETYRSRLRSRLDDDLLTALGQTLIDEIEPLNILSTIREIEQRGAVESAKRILNMASSIFRYGVATGRCLRDTTADIKGALRPPAPPKRRTALPANEIPSFMQALADYDGDEITKLGLKVLILTYVRTGELRFARWSEFENLDGDDPLWRIPAERMKLRRPHLVPLSSQAVSELKVLRKLTGKKSVLFPAPTKSGVISENTLLFAIYRMGYHNRATVHGFRATASTVLNEAQFNRDWIEIQLAHCDGSIRGAYNFAEWLPGRREMMSWWADFLDGKAAPR
jgi:integrase